MIDLLIRDGRLIDPLNGVDQVTDLAIDEGRVRELGPLASAQPARQTLEARGKVVMPGVIDAHTHMRTVLGHPHAQRMIALAGVTTTLDMAGPLDNILDSIPGSGAGVSIAILEAVREGTTLSRARPDRDERRALIESVLERGGIGIKLLGGHFPMDLDICHDFIAEAAELGAWVGWHAGSSVHGSNIEGMRDAVAAAEGRFLHLAHINSYCRGQVNSVLAEASEAIELLTAHPNIFSESYLSPLNGTRLTCADGRPVSRVTATCLRAGGFPESEEGMAQALLAGWAAVLYDNGVIGELISGQRALDYWRERDTKTTGCFPVNPAVSRFLLAQAKRPDGSFVVDSFSTDGGTYPRNVIVENGLLLVAFGALTLREFVIKASLNGARALGLPGKGHLAVGADGDVTILDLVARRAWATVAGGRVIMKDGALLGRGTTIICDERGLPALRRRGIPCQAKRPLDPALIAARFAS